MKIKTVAALCKKNKAFCLYDSVTREGEVGTQWLGDGFSAYPLQGLPLLEEESIYTMFDITDKQQEKITFRRDALPKGINFGDTDACENVIEDEKLSFAVDGKILRPLHTQQGITFIDAAYLAPFSDVADMLELYERVTPGGHIYIAAKTGFLLAGIIFPYDLVRKEFVEKLADLLKQCRFALSEKERRAAEVAGTDQEQMNFGHNEMEGNEDGE